MRVDALDVLAAAGLGLVALGLWLMGYPIALAVVGAVFVVMGISPHLKGRK